jgi:Cu(I)/Ag(I) efflux system protein CusF
MMNSKNTIGLLTAGLLLGHAGAAMACGEHITSAAPTASAPAAMIVGEVRKVQADQGKVTIKHQPIPTLAMPAMTMVFRAQQPKILRDLKPGDKIRFQAESTRGVLFASRIELANQPAQP